MRLSDRLEMVVSFVEPAESAADIGTDHGHVPVELVRRGIVKKALAMDVRKGPLGKAVENISAAGLSEKIESRLSDGMEKLLPKEAETVIIAGMGGELIIHIMERGRHMWESVSQWVLSPHSEIPKVRKWLSENHFWIRQESMVLEDGKYYTILDVRRGGENPEKETDGNVFRYGRILPGRKDPVFFRFLKDEEKQLCGLRDNLKLQAETSERAKERLEETEEKLAYNLEVQHEMQGDH